MVRVWVDGCFDLMHYGHANALRQAKEMGDYLVVGVHSDAEIVKHKGPPVNSEEERYLAVEACKWVDEVVRGAPYVTDLSLMDAYKCDFCVHGDDLVMTADGSDTYARVKQAGRFKECKRTPSVSTTELVGRMLLMTKDHLEPAITTQQQQKKVEAQEKSPYTSTSHILPTSNRIVQFSNSREPRPSDRVVYVDGTFDLFHAGHIEFLKQAKQLGDFLLVGIHNDATVNEIKGGNYPIMNLHERILNVLSCRYVDEVVIGAPYSVTSDLLSSSFSISMVIHGKTALDLDVDDQDPYQVPKQLGIYHEIETKYSFLTTKTIVDRIVLRRQLYEERNRKKMARERAALEALAQTASSS